MINVINAVKKTREYLISQLTGVSVESLNKVPEGFNNNIIWNMGHLIAAQQGICYLRAGLKLAIDEKYFFQYKPGTKPEGYIDEEEVEKIKSLLLSSLDLLAADYQASHFTSYPQWSTRYGVEIGNFDEAIQFLLFHEGLHSGTIEALKKLVAM